MADIEQLEARIILNAQQYHAEQERVIRQAREIIERFRQSEQSAADYERVLVDAARAMGLTVNAQGRARCGRHRDAAWPCFGGYVQA